VELEGLNGYRVLTCLGAVQDLLGAAYVEEGFKACFPGLGDDYALALQGEQRGIPRGLQEPSDAYARRLWFHRQVRRRKGLVWPLAEQLQALLQPYPVVVSIVAGDGGPGVAATRYTLAANGYQYNGDYIKSAPFGTAVIDRTPTAWNWGQGVTPFSFWVVLSGHPWLRDGTWGDAGLWNDLDTNNGDITGAPLDPFGLDTTATYGSTASLVSVNAVRSIAYDWTPPHARCEGIVLAFDSSFPAPTSGNWHLPGERDPNFVYWEPLVQ